ncbi:MAG: glycoside hydrolase family 140 protein [Bacteroidota bacterium]
MKNFLRIQSWLTAVLLVSNLGLSQAQPLPVLKIAADQTSFTAAGKSFFWLGDTGWLLFARCTREEAVNYLDARKAQGFNVVQAMLLHTVAAVNAYGDSALVNADVSRPNLEKRYWEHVDFIIEEAEKRGIYLALVPVWGSNVKDGKVSVAQAEKYAAFLAKRLGKHNNIVWLNGGDIKGSDGMEVWQAIGNTLNRDDERHLITFHPRGRTSSSEWFHNASWLDFNMFQSGHKDYRQDTSSNETNHFGEDNWKFVVKDLQLSPRKPTLDGEPSYENIPHGLHDSLEKRWSAADLRRYAYWSVFAGGAGFTYGENSVMQFHRSGTPGASFGPVRNWEEVLNEPGANQVKYLSNLIESTTGAQRKSGPELLVGKPGDQYNYLATMLGKYHGLVYTYTGRNILVNLAKLGFTPTKASWFDPRTGNRQAIKNAFKGKEVAFNPPGEPIPGNDWVLILEK